jgi:hypothetical protein
MAIIEDFEAIAKRLAELRAAAATRAQEVSELEHGRKLGAIVRQLVVHRRRALSDGRILPRRI